MISIVIPTYNYNITALLEALNTQLEVLKTPYEVICYEDGSTKYIEANRTITSKITHAKHVISKENKGRISTRQLLANTATYDWLLFLDADIVPKNTDFLQQYINCLQTDYDAIYGGYFYTITPPQKAFSLRWKYGKTYEQVSAEIRNKNRYKIVISGNFLIKKSVFLDINSKIDNDGYGYDNYFGALMKLHNTKVFHINNEAIHKGLDTNNVFLNKVEKAVETVAELYQKHTNLTTENTLLEVYKKFKANGLSKPVQWIFKRCKLGLTKQLLSSKPNLSLLQFYKLGYLCTLMSR